MNSIQTAIARAVGLGDLQAETIELRESVDNLTAGNELLARQIEDLDYLNLYDINQIAEVIPSKDRKNTLKRLRRLRHDNPLAKQSIKLICRFTLGKGIQYVVSDDPNKSSFSPVATQDPRNPAGSNDNYDFKQLEPPKPKPTDASEALPPAFLQKNGNGQKPVQPSGQTPPEASLTSSAPGYGQDDEIKTAFDEFWNDDDNRLTFTSAAAMKEWLDGIATDGEKFFVGFTSSAAPYIKLTEIPVEEMDTIIYSSDNWKRPVYYKRSWQPMKYNGLNGFYEPDGQPKTMYYLDYRITDEIKADVTKGINIPASKLAPPDQFVYHAMINPLWTNAGKRGVSELFASREWFRVFKEFMEDRAAINKAATAVAYKRKIKGGPAAVASFSGKFGGLSTGVDSADNAASPVKKLTRPTAGATYDSNPAVDLEWMKTDTGAVNAKEDGRALLMSAGAGVSINSHYFGEGGDANLATAQAMELPMVKSFEDWQDFVGTTCLEIVGWMLRLATDADQAKEQIKRFSFNFPPIISQDIVKWTTAWSQFITQIAPDNQVIIEQAIRSLLTALNVTNIDSLMPRILEEHNRKEIERKVRQQQMLDAIQQNPAGVPPGGQPPVGGARNGSSNVMDPQLRRIAAGRPPAADRNGPKPPR